MSDPRPRQPKPSSTPRRKLTSGYAAPAPAVAALDEKSREFLAAGRVGDPPAPAPGKPRRGRPPSTEDAGPTAPVTARIPDKLYEWLVLAHNSRRARRQNHSRQQDIVAVALHEWLSTHHPEFRPEDWTGRIP